MGRSHGKFYIGFTGPDPGNRGGHGRQYLLIKGLKG